MKPEQNFTPHPAPSSDGLRILLSITNEEDRRQVVETFRRQQVPLLCELRAKGTAPTEFLDILGLGGSTRILTLGYVSKSQVRDVFRAINQSLSYHRRGTGIAVTLPLNGAQGALVRLLQGDAEDPQTDDAATGKLSAVKAFGTELTAAYTEENETPSEATIETNMEHRSPNTDRNTAQTMNPEMNAEMNTEKKVTTQTTMPGYQGSSSTAYALILVNVETGYSDAVVNAARAVGARGGTVLHGRRIAQNAMQDLGLDGQEEQDSVMIVVPAEKKSVVMQAITASCGLNTPAHGVVVSLPVDDVMGLV